ncbi:hypothetical protein AAHA92_31464 [Salvia divinorum]|uniref:Uncharacterized protein n=1 Tax=Salvia divinorum TaxID=28513 RepID=A0ABD1FQX1_SALDI
METPASKQEKKPNARLTPQSNEGKRSLSKKRETKRRIEKGLPIELTTHEWSTDAPRSAAEPRRHPSSNRERQLEATTRWRVIAAGRRVRIVGDAIGFSAIARARQRRVRTESEGELLAVRTLNSFA